MDVLYVGSDLRAFFAMGYFTSDVDGEGNTTVDVGETVTLSGISGGELEKMFEESMTYLGG